MPIERSNFDDLTEGDLADLIGAAVPEGASLEYKSEPHGNSDADRREFLKDVTSFANSAGGHLIVGIDEKGGLPTRLNGLVGCDIDQIINRYESLIRDGVEPRVVGVRLRRVATALGAALVLRIPKSWNPPHRVRVGGWNKFFVRNSGGAHEADVEELRALFTLTADARSRMEKFRIERIEKVAMGRGPALLPGDGRLFLHILPLSAFAQPALLDLEAVFKMGSAFTPLGASGRTDRFNIDGFINLRGGSVCHGYTQVFRDGKVEATKAKVRSNWRGNDILHWSDAASVVEVVPGYLAAMKQLGVTPPLVVSITLEGFGGAKLGVHGYDYSMDEIPPFGPDALIQLPEALIEDYGDDQSAFSALRSPLDALWNAGGFGRSTLYTAEGEFKPPR